MKSIILWCPLLIPISACLWYENKIDIYIENQIYQNPILVQQNPDKRNFLSDLDFSMKKYYNKQENLINEKIKMLVEASDATKETLPYEIKREIESAFVPATYRKLNINRAKVFDFRLKAKNRVKKTYNTVLAAVTAESNKAFEATISNLGDSACEFLEQVLYSTDKSINDFSDFVKPEVSQALEKNRNFVYDKISKSYYTIKFFKLVLNILFWTAVIKSFFYVFARVVYKKDENSGMTFSITEGEITTSGEIKTFDNQYTIFGQNKGTYYVRRKFSPVSYDPDLVWPQPFKCFFSRNFSLCYAMNRISMKDSNERTRITAGRDREFVEYKLKKDERCIFRFTDFVGMTEGIKLKTIYSFKLSSFLFGRFRFTTAKGDGRIIFISDGGTIYSPLTDSTRSISLSKIIAFQDKSNFNVGSKLNIRNVFLSNFHLRKEENGNIIINGQDRSGISQMMGAFKFFWGFFLPI